MRIAGAAGQVIRETRQKHGLTQAQLALRAGTTQTAISRLERDQRSPTVDTLNRLLLVMGERLDLVTQPLEAEADRIHLAAERRRPMAERLESALEWNRFASQLSGAARRGG